MKKEYLSEAFRQLELLNEEDFNLSTTADNSDLKDFLDNDDISVMSLDVIDPEAETEEDLEDSYTGKVILDCCVCHSKLYKDKEEVTVDEEEDLANTDEECPFCYSNDGFKIIGEVAPYGETEAEPEVEEEPEDIEHEENKEDMDEGFKTELIPNNGRKSFYGKAVVDTLDDGSQVLYSYNTPIIKKYPNGELKRLYDGWSATTGSHIKAFCGLDKKGFLNLEYEQFNESLNKGRKLKESKHSLKESVTDDYYDLVNSLAETASDYLKDNPEYDKYDAISDAINNDLIYYVDQWTVLQELGESPLEYYTDDVWDALYSDIADRMEVPEEDDETNESLKTRKNRKLKESVKNGYRGSDDIEYVWKGPWSDPELVYDGKTFNYWDIEDALWSMFLEENPQWTDDDSNNPECEDEFNRYVQLRGALYLDDVIAGGYFDESLKTRNLKEEVSDEAYEIASYIDNAFTNKNSVSLGEFNEVFEKVKSKILSDNFEYDDLDSEVRGILSYMGWETDFESGDLIKESLKSRKNKSVNESEDGRKLFTEYKILVDGRTYEISHTKQRADEIVPILKDMYPDSEIEAKPYKHYASGIERKRLERQIADQLKEYGVNESVNESNDELSKIKLNAKKAALRDGYDQVIYIDDDGEYGIRRYITGLKPRNDEKFVFIVKIYYDKGIQKVNVEKFPEIEESLNGSNRKPGFENMSMKDLYYYYRDNIDPDEYPTFLHWAETIVTPANSENDEIEESLDESIQEIEIETDTDKIKIESEPKEESGETEDVLAPVSPETEQQIENNSSDEIDVPIDEFDEETFDELGESFLKNTYENVKGYKTESVKEQDGNKLVVEGLITFNSGKVKKTSFIFESKDITKSGKVRFIGENCQLSRGKKSFTVAGKVQEGKFISESLNYNYRAKDAKSGKSTRMYGTVRTNK